jgi:hypothetical protein
VGWLLFLQEQIKIIIIFLSSFSLSPLSMRRARHSQHVARPLVLPARVRPLARRAASPRRTFSATADPINTYWRDQGLDTQYHTFAAILQSNYVSPHQFILDTNIDYFGHPDAGHALMSAAANYPEEPPSDDDSA